MQVRRLLLRAWTSLTTWPSARAWLMAAGIGAGALAIELTIGLAGGFLRPAPADGSMLWWSLPLALIVPSLGEELVFRGLLVPGREETRTAWRAIPLSTAVFAAWHVFEALTFMRAAASIFLRPDFLATTAVLGLACG